MDTSEFDEFDDTVRNYNIVRFYAPHLNRSSRVMERDLTEREARIHCNDPKTAKKGSYFDGFQEQ